jgi:fatty-acyl-CoA synthase
MICNRRWVWGIKNCSLTAADTRRQPLILIIITGGENVYPKEVEDTLHQHKTVNECGVVGFPDPEYGEAVTAFVTLKPGATADERTLIAFCKEQIARYKAPKKIHFVADLPKTPQGKILRRELRKLGR